MTKPLAVLAAAATLAATTARADEHLLAARTAEQRLRGGVGRARHATSRR